MNGIATPLGVPALSNPTGNTTISSEPFGDFADLCDIDLPDLGPMGINWISPGYQYDLDWDMMPNNGATISQAHNVEEQAIRVPVTGLHLPDDGTEQQAHQATPSPITAQSCSSGQTTLTPHSAGGEYYVDGDGSRAPFGGRYHSRGSFSHSQVLAVGTGIGTVSAEASRSSDSPHLCSLEAYGNFVQASTRELQLEGLDTDITKFPSHAQIELYVQQYFKKFSPIFPFLRLAALREEASQEWLLLLAVAAIGSRYVPASQDSYNILLQTLDVALDRRKRSHLLEPNDMNDNDLYVPGRNAGINTSTDLQTLRAGILHLVCLLQSGKQSMLGRALTLRHYLVNICNSLQLLDRSAEDDGGDSPSSMYTDPRSWLKKECEIRAGMVLWVCNAHFHASKRWLICTVSRFDDDV
jgi:hypothetical protein